MQQFRCAWLFEPRTLARTMPGFRARYARTQKPAAVPDVAPMRPEANIERERAVLRYLAALDFDRAA